MNGFVDGFGVFDLPTFRTVVPFTNEMAEQIDEDALWINLHQDGQGVGWFLKQWAWHEPTHLLAQACLTLVVDFQIPQNQCTVMTSDELDHKATQLVLTSIRESVRD